MSYSGRDFFKLLRIELQCELAPNHTILVDPRIDAAPDLLSAEDSRSASVVYTKTPKALSVEAMEIDARPPMSQPPEYQHDRHAQRHDHEQQHQQPLQLLEVNRQSLPPQTTSLRSPSILSPLQSIAQKATPTNTPTSASPALKPTHEVSHTPHVPPHVATVNSMSSIRRPSSVAPQTFSPYESHHVNGHQYPRSPPEVGLDAVERLQTQISQNSGALAAHTRDIRRGEEAFTNLEENLRREFRDELIRQSADMARVEELATRLHHESQGVRQAIDAITRELHAARVERQSQGSTDVPQGQSFGPHDAALDLMAQQMAEMSHKTAEIENLRLTVEIMKGKIFRLEGGSTSVSSQQPVHAHQTPRGSFQASQSTHTAPPSHDGTPAIVHSNNAPQPTQMIQNHRPSIGTPSSTPAPDNVQRAEPATSQSSGWATINAGVKRSHQNVVGSPHEVAMHTPGSPKRQKLANIEFHTGHAASHGYEAGHQQHIETPIADTRFQTPVHTLPSQQSIPESVLASLSQQSANIPYATQEGPSDEIWRRESQRIIEHRSHGRGRGGGPGSRGGRIRKSMPAQFQHALGTPEWEREDWQGVPDSQPSSDGYYNHVAARPGRGGIARRGSGGGGTRGGYVPSDRATSLGLQGVTAIGISFGSTVNDNYGSTKKTRSKPIRNADGVLIRKDGRPDMRSQSSAANLRKIHTRKEGEASHSPTATNMQYANSAAPDTPNPSRGGYVADPHATDKHNAIMGKMFPTGIDASRKQHDYMRQVFEQSRDHTGHPRSQNYVTNNAIEVKKEQVERNGIAETQSPGDGDMQMEGQDGNEVGVEGGGVHLEPEKGGAVQAGEQVIPETQAAESPVTVGGSGGYADSVGTKG
jgi:hypothetical protein